MRSPTINNNYSSSHEMNDFNVNDSSISELQEMTAYQQAQIARNQQLLNTREQRLRYINEQQTTQENRRIDHLKDHIEQQEKRNVRLKTLENQINNQKTSNSTFEDGLEILKEIFLNKEHDLSISLNKLDELTKQLDQLRKFRTPNNNEQSPNQTQLEKLKQELIIRNNLNEQQNRKIAYQREVYSTKQAELTQLDHRIEELRQRLTKKKPSATSNDFRTALNTVQDTLNNINIGEIEKRMLHLANSFNSIHTNGRTITNPNDRINNSSSPKKTSPSISSKIAFASKSEIAATYMACPLTITPTSPPLLSTDIPITFDQSTVDPIDLSILRSTEQLLPANLRLNDDKLSVHFNNVASNVKKRHSLSDPSDLLIKYLPPNIEQQPIQVRDDSLTNSTLPNIEPPIVAYETPSDPQTDESDGELPHDQTIMESFISDTESEGGSLSEDNESVISFPAIPVTNLKSLLKTATTPKNTTRRVIFNPLALLLDAAVLGELELLIKSARQVTNISQPNDEGLTALHNAVCASNFECVKFLVEFGCDINYADNDGWTPLHCAASCNNTSVVKFLIEHGACIYATTTRDNETAVEKCEEEEDNYSSCSEYLRSIQNDFGVINDGLVYALYDYEPDLTTADELEFNDGDQLIILKHGDENESEWYWARHQNTAKEGYIPRNYLGLYPRVPPDTLSSRSS